jgi:hypothetical protein
MLEKRNLVTEALEAHEVLQMMPAKPTKRITDEIT